MNRTKAIQTITNLLRILNRSNSEYHWVNEYSNAELQQMLNGWQTNQPELFYRHGYYVM